MIIKKAAKKDTHTHEHEHTHTDTAKSERQQREREREREGGEWEFLYQDAKKVKMAKEKLTRYGKFISRQKCASVCVSVCLRASVQIANEKSENYVRCVCMWGGGRLFVVRPLIYNSSLRPEEEDAAKLHLDASP